MSVRKQIMDLKNEYTERTKEQPTKIKLTSNSIMAIETDDASGEIMGIIFAGNHNDLIGKKIIGLEIVDIDADEMGVL